MSGSVPPPQWLKSTIFTFLLLVTYTSSAYESHSGDARANAPLMLSCQNSTRVSSSASFWSTKNG